MTKIEEHNTTLEIKEIVSKCIKCGMCNNFCPVLREIREEDQSPRGLAVAMDQGYYEELVYKCTLCNACEENCPVELKLNEAFIKARKLLVMQKREMPENKEMVNNFKKTGNVFGIKLNVIN